MSEKNYFYNLTRGSVFSPDRTRPSRIDRAMFPAPMKPMCGLLALWVDSFRFFAVEGAAGVVVWLELRGTAPEVDAIFHKLRPRVTPMIIANSKVKLQHFSKKI